MSMLKLSFLNFKSSFKNYLSLIIALSFTILIFFNFFNMIDSGVLSALSQDNLEKTKIIIQVIIIVLIIFMIFFIWYSTNVFLTRRKKEIGIYAFMRITHLQIGRLYMIEITLIGFVSLLIGLLSGGIFGQLFQMFFIHLSDIHIDMHFSFSMSAVIKTSVIYLTIYMIFVAKGFVNIVRSNILDLLSYHKQNELIKQNNTILMIKTIIGIVVLGYGYYIAIAKGGMEVLNNVLKAVICVIVGIYFIFGGLIPFIFQTLKTRKMFLYKKERTLWINNIIFRIKKNYRTYAITCILMLCSVTALATGFAMKQRYDNMMSSRHVYNYQVMSQKKGLKDYYQKIIEKKSQVKYGSSIAVLQLDSSLMSSRYSHTAYAVLSYSQVKALAKQTGLEFSYKEPKSNEYVKIERLYMLTILTDRSNEKITINKKTYHMLDFTTEAYLGYMQEKISLYMISDSEYQKLLPLGKEVYFYNYKIKDMKSFETSKQDLRQANDSIGLVSLNPNEDNEMEWIKSIYALCVFMFLVFVVASGSIIFMKLYNDAFEDKSRYLVLNKLGINHEILKKSIGKELFIIYAFPLLIMSISSYFSVKALANMMQTELLMINLTSVIVVIVLFIIFYVLSNIIYRKIVEVK